MKHDEVDKIDEIDEMLAWGNWCFLRKDLLGAFHSATSVHDALTLTLFNCCHVQRWIDVDAEQV